MAQFASMLQYYAFAFEQHTYNNRNPHSAAVVGSTKKCVMTTDVHLERKRLLSEHPVAS